MSKPLDVLVIGGGPAGATASALLASWGRSVALIDHDSRQPSLAESLPASTRKLLRLVGQIEVVDSAGFHPNQGNVSRWAGREATAESADAGYHVSRSVFDRLLREHARAQGASIIDAKVQRVDVCGEGPARAGAHQAQFVLDCTGRAGLVARRGLRRADVGYRTLAIAAEWECPDWPLAERTHTFVESYRDGWAWSVPLSAARRQCTVMIDAQRTKLRKGDLLSAYRRELRKARSIDARLARARQVSMPWACDASLYSCTRAAESRALLVGDAASFIEPLSSAGVKKALASAWRAAVVVNTVLDKPAMLGAAFDYHDRREREVYDDCLRRSARFFKDAAAVFDDRFWLVRARSDGSAAELPNPETDPSVLLACERFRHTPGFDLTPRPPVWLRPVAVIEGRELVLREAVVFPGRHEPVRFLAGVNLPELTRIAARCHDVGSVIEAYHDRVARVDPRSVLLGLSVLVARGVMSRRDAPDPTGSA